MPNITLADIVKFEQQCIARKPYRFVILGDEKELDLKQLQQTTGASIRRVTTNQIFGY